MSEHEASTNKLFRHISTLIDISSNYTWINPWRDRNCKTKTDDFSNIVATSKLKRIKVEYDR